MRNFVRRHLNIIAQYSTVQYEEFWFCELEREISVLRSICSFWSFWKIRSPNYDITHIIISSMNSTSQYGTVKVLIEKFWGLCVRAIHTTHTVQYRSIVVFWESWGEPLLDISLGMLWGDHLSIDSRLSLDILLGMLWGDHLSIDSRWLQTNLFTRSTLHTLSTVVGQFLVLRPQ